MLIQIGSARDLQWCQEEHEMGEEIRKQWILKCPARRLFRIAVVASLLLTATLAALTALLWNLGVQDASAILTVSWLKPIWFILAVVGTPLSLFLWLGMLWHCVSMYKRNGWLKASWLAYLIVGNWLFSPLYYFVVYRRRDDGTALSAAFPE
jgi:hypothetical protein